MSEDGFCWVVVGVGGFALGGSRWVVSNEVVVILQQLGGHARGNGLTK